MQQDRLTALLQPLVEALQYELWGVVYMPRGGQSLLRVYIDSPKGISVDDCATVSEQLSAFLDVEEPIGGEYVLEISSPGLERPLYTQAHYERYLGHAIKVNAFAPVDKRRKFIGTLQRVSADAVVIETKEGEAELAWSNIAKANLVYEG